MLKFSNETKVGLVAIIALAGAFWGYKFLKGVNVLTTSQTFYVRYDNVDQLRPSSPIFISGLQVGMVKDIYIDKEDDKSLIVVLNVDRGIQIPKDATAAIIGLTLMGGKAIELVIPHPCNGPDCAESESFLKGETRSIARSLLGDPNDLNAYVDRLRTGFDSLANPNDPNGVGPSLRHLENSLREIDGFTTELNRFMRTNASSYNRVSTNAAVMSDSLRASMISIRRSLDGLAELATELKNAGLTQNATKALDSVLVTVATLRGTLESTTQTIGRVDVLAQKLANGEGSAGKLLTDDALYTNLDRVVRQMDFLSQDIRLHPERYTNFRVRLFGKNKGTEYLKPENDPIYDPEYRRVVDSLEAEYRKRKAAADGQKK
jgi:phospholipid/cholesterol/gamma-HCH transport system substrate-binding protein